MTQKTPEHVSEYDRQMAKSLDLEAQEIKQAQPSAVELLVSIDRSLRTIKGSLIFFVALACLTILIGFVAAAAR